MTKLRSNFFLLLSFAVDDGIDAKRSPTDVFERRKTGLFVTFNAEKHKDTIINVVFLHFNARNDTGLRKSLYLCKQIANNRIMCTVTLSYNQNSALARRKLAALLSSGLFVQLTEPMPDDEAALQEHRETRDAFLEASKRSMSHVITKHL